MFITNKRVNTESFETNVNGNRIKESLIIRICVITDEKLTWKENFKRLCCTTVYANTLVQGKTLSMM